MLHLRMKKLPCRLSSAALAAFIFITAGLAGAPFSRTEAYAADKDKTNTTLRPGKPTAPTNAGEDTWNGSKVYYGKCLEGYAFDLIYKD